MTPTPEQPRDPVAALTPDDIERLGSIATTIEATIEGNLNMFEWDGRDARYLRGLADRARASLEALEGGERVTLWRWKGRAAAITGWQGAEAHSGWHSMWSSYDEFWEWIENTYEGRDGIEVATFALPDTQGAEE